MRYVALAVAIMSAALGGSPAQAEDRMPPAAMRDLLISVGIDGGLLADQRADCQSACFSQGTTCRTGCRSIQDNDRRQACLNSCNSNLSTCQRDCRN